MDQRAGELDQARSLLIKTQEQFLKVTESEQRLRGDLLTEHDLYEATLEQLKEGQGKRREKEAEVDRLQAAIRSRDQEVTALNESIRSEDHEIELKDGQIRDQGTELDDLTYQISDKQEQLREETDAVGQLTADLELVLSLGTRAGDARVQDWAPFLRSLRDSVPVQVSPGEDVPWAWSSSVTLRLGTWTTGCGRWP